MTLRKIHCKELLSIWTGLKVCTLVKIQPFPKRQILDSSKLKKLQMTTLHKFKESGRKFSKQVGNTVGKGEIAHYEQFLLFPQCFQRRTAYT